MIDKGANPFIVDYAGNTKFESLNLQYLSNLPTEKSVYFTTRPFEVSPSYFPDPWFYRTGIFDGKFDSEIGQGASGKVLSGVWLDKKAAFKFVEVGSQTFQGKVKDNLKILNKQLSEMKAIQATEGSKIVSFYGHYRYVNM